MKEYKLFINNQWVDGSEKETFLSYDKGNGETVSTLATATPADGARACEAARAAFDAGVWSDLDPAVRADYMMKVAEIMKRRAHEMAEIESRETGKPIKETSGFDIPVSIWAFEYFANISREVKGEVIPVGDINDRAFDFVTYEPFGVALIIPPFNFPLHLLTRSLCPALAAGNTCVVKASSVTPTTAVILGEIFEEAGVPAGVYNVVNGDGKILGNALALHRDVDIIGFTGSERVGRELMRRSSESEIIKKCILELGGKGPAIVEADADIDIATTCQIEGFTFNQGEVCCAMTRLILHEDVYDEYLEMLAGKCDQIKIGYPLNEDTDMGALIAESHLKSVEKFVSDSLEAGAKLYYGGKRLTGGEYDKGAYYGPTIITDVTTDMEIWKEEVFGPVLCVVKYKDLDDAVALANDNTTFGLGANVFTENLKKAYWTGKKLNAGSVWVNLPNGMNMACPFGGNKNSGMSREYGTAGLHEYMKIKNNMWRMK
jgi:acyl-CoA reductase-like NAD-dependent aldehyde dehydrogenase